MKAPEMRTVLAMDDIESFDDSVQRKLVMLRQVLGDEVTVERIKYFLHGANGDEEVALNHILNEVEKGRKTKSSRVRETTEKPTTVNEETVNPPLPTSTDKILYELAEEVKCPLCLSYFNKPMILACFHTFCAPCIEDIVTGDSCFDCPLCRTKIQLDERGVNGLKVNHYLANIVEKLRGAQNTKMCDECQRTLCTVVCKNCKAFLCNGCNDKIHAIRLMNSHHRVPFEECFFTSSRSSSFSALDLSDTVKWESDLVIPFNVKKEVCTDLFYSWAKELWFAPGDFLKSAILKEFKMVYVPYWVFEVDTQSRYVVSYADKLFGETNETGSIGARHVDLLVCASSCNEAPLLEQIEPWKIDQTTAFTLKHAEGAEVRPFTMDADSCWRMKAKVTVEQNCKDSCRRKQRSNIRTDNVTKINVDTTYSNRNSRRLFLPIYSTTFEYKNKKYLFVVNGSTAKAFGHRPYSTGKLASLSFTGFGAAVGFLTGTRLSPP